VDFLNPYQFARILAKNKKIKILPLHFLEKRALDESGCVDE
jgi:hypothetical protein